MQEYTNFGEGRNTPVTELVDEVLEHRARHLSRKIGIAYHLAVAMVRANIPVKETRHG